MNKARLNKYRYAVGAALLLLGMAARADLWVYVDDAGITHFAAARVNERYELFYQEGKDADASPAPDGNADADVWERLPETRRVFQPPLSRRFANLDKSKGYQAVRRHLQAVAAMHNIDSALLKAVAAMESNFRAGVVSPRGAIGLMQLMPGTARRYGVVADKEGLKDFLGRPMATLTVEQKLADPYINIDAGARHLAHLMKLYKGQPELALAAYNAGPGAVRRSGNKVPDIRETRDYVKTVIDLYAAYKPVQPAEDASATAARIRNSRSMRFDQGGG